MGRMQRSDDTFKGGEGDAAFLNPGITEELAEEAILRLREKNLVATLGSPSTTSRRQVLATLGAIAVPLVVSLTMADQKAYADVAGSNGSIRPSVHISEPTGQKD